MTEIYRVIPLIEKGKIRQKWKKIVAQHSAFQPKSRVALDTPTNVFLNELSADTSSQYFHNSDVISNLREQKQSCTSSNLMSMHINFNNSSNLVQGNKHIMTNINVNEQAASYQTHQQLLSTSNTNTNYRMLCIKAYTSNAWQI